MSLPECMYDYRPSYPETKQVSVCKNCGWGIYEGQAYTEIDGKTICNDCIDGYLRKSNCNQKK